MTSSRRTIMIATLVLVAIATMALIAIRGREKIEGRGDYTHNFGERRAGEVVRHTFRIINPSSETWVLNRLVPTCSCTVVKGFPAEILAHSSVEVPVEMEIRGGSLQTSASVTALFTNREPLVLKLIATVFEHVPSQMDFGTVRSGELVQRTFMVRTGNHRPIHISKVDHDPRWFELSDAADPEHPTDRRVTVRLREDAPVGPINSSIRVFADNPEMISTIRVRGHVLRPLEFGQSSIVLLQSNPNAAFQMHSPYGKPRQS